MFYYPTVLKRHSGCFSTIWLVATKGIRVTRRDFLKVNIKVTCDDIVNYLLERVPPPLPDLPQPRFSLYLSSQLQYGVVLVFHRQCVIFLEELQSVVGQLAKQRTSQKIDMDEHSRLALDFPDALTLLEEAEGAPDPLFGVMSMHESMPSPTTLIQMGKEFLRETSPEHPERTSPSVAAALDNGITASPETITLREMEPVAIPIAEFEGVELLDQHPYTIDFLLAQTDHFPEDLEIPREEVTPGDRESGMEEGRRDADLEREGAKEPTASTLELQPTTTLSGEEAMLLPDEESAEMPGPPTDQLTPVSAPPLPSPQPAARGHERPTLELEDIPPAEVKKRRKRQLIFFDPETQISQAVLQQQIDNPQAETRQLNLPPPSPQRIRPAAELFNNPCTFLPEQVLFLWRQAANIRPVSGPGLQVGEQGPESTDSERERQREMEEADQIEEILELSPKEVPRDVAEAEMFDISAHGSLPLEGSDLREMSREISPMLTSEREETPVSRSVSILKDIPEVPDETLQRAAAESPWLLPDLTEQESSPVLFHSLLPQEADRRTVSNIFQKLLETLSTRKVCVKQGKPYGAIQILPGPNYEEAIQTLV
ncbi:meiotic recombination protein REC8 homolog [Labrus mixtus]|uniref:meiotic recombination protein REC8 homolog n=1 Tax=Labrus mixtus TaxID=508554 RepID=UPI0029BFC956|nr:meiotic recombination protein REC8 homolog [Labrus mixtus]